MRTFDLFGGGRMVSAIAAVSVVSSCATVGGGGAGGRWAVDTVVEQCIGTIFVATALGAVLGAVTSGGHTGRGAGIGAGVGLAAGTVACAILVEIDKQDRERVRLAQLMAAETGEKQVIQYDGSDGRRRDMVVEIQPAAGRKVSTQMRAAGGEKSQPVAPNAMNEDTSRTATKIEEAAGGVVRSSGEDQVCRTTRTQFTIATMGSTELPQQTICRTPEGNWEPI